MKHAIIMGSLVLDITPTLRSPEVRAVEDIFVQGKVTELGNVAFYMGGCVGNTGLALHKLGVPVTLCGKVGEDFAGNAIELLAGREGAPLRLSRVPGVPTTVSVAVTPPGLDKITLFLRGASQEYDSADAEGLPEADLFHFGYPVTMKWLYANGGEELVQLYRRVRATGMTASLDTALPRPDSEPGQVNWRPILERVLPEVDIFVPSFEECLFMLDRDAYCARFREAAGRDIIDSLDWEEVRGIAGTFLSMGAKVVLLKLGSCGMYLRTADEAVLAKGGRALKDYAADWSDRELWIFPNTVERIVSTTGAGDVGIAGFLATLLRGGQPVRALQVAATASSLCIQSADSTSLLRPWEELADCGVTARRTVNRALPAGQWRAEAEGLFRGSLDRDF